ncbi:MAG: hypothetical protein WCY56_03545 [Aminobacteriaceae bacterium]
MKRILLSIVLVSALLSLAAMSIAATVEGVSLGDLPSGWQEKEPIDESIERYFIYQEKKTVLAEMMWLEEELPEDFAPEDYLDALKENSMPSFAEYAPLEDEMVKLHGRDAAVHRFHFTNQRDTLKGELYVFVVGETGYVFLFDTTDAWFKKLQPKFQAFVKDTLHFPGDQKQEPVIVEDDEGDEEMPAFTEDDEYGDEEEGLPPLVEEDEDEEGDSDGDLPSFVDDDEEEEGVFTIGGTSIYIALPEGAEEMERDDGEILISGPDESEIYIVLLDGPEAVAEMMAEQTEGARKQDTSTLKCGGRSVDVTLYSQKQDGATDAVLAATWEGTGVSVGIRIPQKNYKGASGWIKEMLCSVEVLSK